jgi:uncharacterized protein (DUF362 family)
VEQKVGGGTEDLFFAKCTHGSVIRAVIDYVLLALGGQGEVAFGNAPLQSCDWSAVTQQSGATRVEEFYRRPGFEGPTVRLTDLRQHIIHRGALGGVSTELHAETADACVNVEFGEDSLLDQLYGKEMPPRFRVLDYDPTRTAGCHASGRHRYIINRRILESDTIISIPKLKTHEKVGITCGIKGCVGTVAHKDCLAHHRYGSPRQGGDEYPDNLAVLGFVSAIHDWAYSSRPGPARSALHTTNYFARKAIRRFTRAVSGSWPGNDTCWRMAVDLARIAKYADQAGVLRPEQQRHHLMFTDGIIAGEGDGPLSPSPVRLGFVSFNDDLVIGDYVNALAMGFDPERIPMIREAASLGRYPLTEVQPAACTVTVNGRSADVKALGSEFRRRFRPATEWRRAI